MPTIKMHTHAAAAEQAAAQLAHYQQIMGDWQDPGYPPKPKKPKPPEPVGGHRYTNFAEMYMRLGNTIVWYKNRPVFLTAKPGPKSEAVEWWHMNATDLITGETNTVSTDDPDLTLASPGLGYVNSKKEGPLYLCRYPDRLQHQGLSTSYIRYIDTTEKVCCNISAAVSHKELGSSMMGEYPKYSVAKRHAAADGMGEAFHRRFAIAKIKDVLVVCGRGIVLGPFDHKTDTLFIRQSVKDLPMVTELKEWMHVVATQG